jgi:Mn-dependent DtxR family transcriptional regulator
MKDHSNDDLILNRSNESDILTIVKEDILRTLGEKKKVSLEIIKDEIKVSPSFISRVINELEKEELVRSQQSIFELTEKGKKRGKDVLKRHLVLEHYFKKTRSKQEAHKIAHIIEHYISEETIRNIKKLSTFKESGLPLTELAMHKESIIADIVIPSYKLFERIISMGIFPGEKIRVMNEIPGTIIVQIENKKFALDRNIAKEIKVLEI